MFSDQELQWRSWLYSQKSTPNLLLEIVESTPLQSMHGLLRLLVFYRIPSPSKLHHYETTLPILRKLLAIENYYPIAYLKESIANIQNQLGQL